MVGGLRPVSAFEIRGVAGRAAVDDAVLAVVRRTHEFVRGVAADRAALGFDRQVFETAAGEDAAVRAVHRLIGLVQRFERRVKAVGVLHQELAGAEDSEPRTLFVAEFRLNLKQVQRQLAVAADELRDEIGDDFFVRRAEGEVGLAVASALLPIEQDVAEGFLATGADEEVDRLQRGHVDFDGPGGFHLLADNGFGFSQSLPAQRQVGVAAGHELPDQSGSQHELVAGDFRVRRNFLHRRDQSLGPARHSPGIESGFEIGAGF